MRYQVPQFIEVEDKIFGPLTFRQFAYLAGGVGVGVILYRFGGLIPTALIAVPFGIMCVMMAFYKINNRPFIEIIEASIKYFVKGRLYIWKNREMMGKKEIRQEDARTIIKPIVPKVSENKLKDLAWSLDIKESMYNTKDQLK